jgi:predicted MFS family arabinose efflux permease
LSAFLGRYKLPLVFVVVVGCIIGVVSFGARAGLGLMLQPISIDFNWGREIFALSLAIQNLLWGFFQPFAGILADKFGAGRTLAVGAVIYAASLFFMSKATTPLEMHLSAGFLMGLGTAMASFMIVMATLQRAAPPKRRSLVMGIATASGSIGQFTMVPLGNAWIDAHGWQTACVYLALTLIAVLVASTCITGKGTPRGPEEDQTVRAALREALRHRSYNLLTAGFFVCGFHVAFIMAHFPSYLKDKGFDSGVGATALALIGLFNIVGSIGAGWIGGRFSKRWSLSAIYLARATAVALFVLLPISQTTIYVFAAVLGLLWLSTVPLTQGLVAQFFGLRYVATLFGVVFFSHQVGAFLGVWLGGRLFDETGSYAIVWWMTVGLALLAAAVHVPIREAPVARLAARPA